MDQPRIVSIRIIEPPKRYAYPTFPDSSVQARLDSGSEVELFIFYSNVPREFDEQTFIGMTVAEARQERFEESVRRLQSVSHHEIPRLLEH